MTEDVAMLHVVQVDDDKIACERAGNLALRNAVTTRHCQAEAADENGGAQCRRLA